jgi:hypothetical protein
LAALENLGGRFTAQTVQIPGSTTGMTINASTMDVLEGKQPLCESVLSSCQRVRQNVWGTFLREAAPALKTAEVLAEENLRTSCIKNVATCFQTACKDNIDPANPDGSYDMCLSRPDTFMALCRNQVTQCERVDKTIMDFVRARLAGMRVDSCTNEMKSCLTSTNNCGADYSQCIGLDIDAIIKMCPPDKLLACSSSNDYKTSADNFYDETYKMIQGIILNIDNSQLANCQKALDTAMAKTCGSTENCDAFAFDEGLGSRSLEYKICEFDKSSGALTTRCRPTASNFNSSEISSMSLGGIIEGIIYWDLVEPSDETADITLTTDDRYIEGITQNMGFAPDASQTKIIQQKVIPEIRNLQNGINKAVAAIESDPTVQYCMRGRAVRALDNTLGSTRTGRDLATDSDGNLLNDGRFPRLTDNARIIIKNSAIRQARKEYYVEYSKLIDQMQVDAEHLGSRANGAAACAALAENSILRGVPMLDKVGTLGALVSLAAGIYVPITQRDNNFDSGTKADSNNSNVNSSISNVWNYRQTVTTTFNDDTLICSKCTKTQNCAQPKSPLFGSKYCKTWADEEEVCDEISFGNAN